MTNRHGHGVKWTSRGSFTAEEKEERYVKRKGLRRGGRRDEPNETREVGGSGRNKSERFMERRWSWRVMG